MLYVFFVWCKMKILIGINNILASQKIIIKLYFVLFW